MTTFALRIDEKLQLRQLQVSDADELFMLTEENRDYLRKWLPWLDRTKKPIDTQNFIQSIRDQFNNTEGFVAAIEFENHIIGVIGFNEIDWYNRIGYIGYWLASSNQGKGIITTSCQRIINHSFTNLGLNRLVITCASENKPSRAVPERLGFKHEGTAREAEWLYDHFVDHEIYALLRCDWEQKAA